MIKKKNIYIYIYIYIYLFIYSFIQVNLFHKKHKNITFEQKILC